MAGKFKRWYWRRQLQSMMRNRITGRKQVGLSGASTIGIYYAYRTQEEYDKLTDFARLLAGKSKKVKLLVYSEEKEIPLTKEKEFSVSVMGTKDVNFGYFPHKRVPAAVRSFLNTEYDLLLDFSPEFHYLDVSVMASCCSRMKVGKYGEWNVRVNDVSLSADERRGYVTEFVHAIETYLPMFD